MRKKDMGGGEVKVMWRGGIKMPISQPSNDINVNFELCMCVRENIALLFLLSYKVFACMWGGGLTFLWGELSNCMYTHTHTYNQQQKLIAAGIYRHTF